MVEEAGPATTLQDAGRIGLARLGIPRAGAADELARIVANRLVGNHDRSAVIKTTGSGPRLRFSSAAVVAVVGDVPLGEWANLTGLGQRASRTSARMSVTRWPAMRGDGIDDNLWTIRFVAGTTASIDMSVVAQLRPGSRLRLTLVDVDGAARARRAGLGVLADAIVGWLPILAERPASQV